jgi:hypothetical protein
MKTWGRMVSGGRLAIGLSGFARGAKPITNRLQVANLPHADQRDLLHFEADALGKG